MARRIADLPKHDRPREKMLERGPSALSDEELAAVLLGSGVKGHDVMTVAARIVRLVDDCNGRPRISDLVKLNGANEVITHRVVTIGLVDQT